MPCIGVCYILWHDIIIWVYLRLYEGDLYFKWCNLLAHTMYHWSCTAIGMLLHVLGQFIAGHAVYMGMPYVIA
jgi:hypothetical protein